MEIARLNELGPSEAADALLPCCASSRWVADLINGRPYRSLARLVNASDTALAGLAWADISEALAAHPRIGARAAPGGPGADRGAAWSAAEQRSARDLDECAREQLRAANAQYERRFGHVFLICASGKSLPQLLDALRERLGHDPATEREVVRAELREIVTLRLAKAFR